MVDRPHGVSGALGSHPKGSRVLVNRYSSGRFVTAVNRARAGYCGSNPTDDARDSEFRA